MSKTIKYHVDCEVAFIKKGIGIRSWVVGECSKCGLLIDFHNDLYVTENAEVR